MSHTNLYHSLLHQIFRSGQPREDRTGVGTLSIFGHQAMYDYVGHSFPLITTKKVHFKSIVHELLWFIKGDTNVKYLQDNGVKIWDAWADENGELGPVYGEQWRAWLTDKGTPIDQLEQVIDHIKQDPCSRRHVVSAWNVTCLDSMALAPCHCLFQFYVQGKYLHCQLYQRSADVFLGVPFNIASYSLLLMMVAQVVGLTPGHFIHTLGDAHIYSNHMDVVKTQLGRKVRPDPQVELNREVKHIDDFKYEDVALINYDPWPGLQAPVAV